MPHPCDIPNDEPFLSRRLEPEPRPVDRWRRRDVPHQLELSPDWRRPPDEAALVDWPQERRRRPRCTEDPGFMA